MHAPPDNPAPAVKFVEARPSIRVPSKHDAIREALAARPGEWALIADDLTERQAGGRATAIRGGSGRWAPAGRWEASVRRVEGTDTWSVFARCVAP
jgi:hypothetical protein